MAEKKEEEKKDRTALLLAERKKIIFNLVLFATAAVVVLFGVLTMAWFAMNKKSSGTSMSVSVKNVDFEIVFPGTQEGRWINQYNNLTLKNDIWLLTGTHNLDNSTNTATEEIGLEPGDSGILEFRVKPKGEREIITVNLTFSMRAIEKNGSSMEATDALEITETNADLMKMLMAHVMLFTGIDSNGKYTGLIDNDELNRILTNRTYSISDTEFTKIYWVWPMHLSNIISKESRELVYASDLRQDVITYIVKNKTGFFKGITTDDTRLTQDLTDIKNYGSYSILYDKADLDIGNHVKYLILGLTAEIAE